MGDAPPDNGPLALICGGGTLPAAVAEAAIRAGRKVVLFPIRGWADAALVERYPHCWLAVAQAGRFRRRAAAEGCRDVAFIGTARRPALRALRLDWLALRLLPRIWRIYRGGDDHLLSGVLRLFEDHGFRVVAAHAVAPEILMPAGSLGSRMPGPDDLVDIARALALLRTIGPYDVGQAAVVAANHVLAVEAVEGTDEMLARIADLRARGRIATPAGAGVLVKAAKPEQDRRIDLPTIGPRTVTEAAQAGLAGIAVLAGEAIVAEPHAVAAAADAAKIFVVGIGKPP